MKRLLQVANVTVAQDSPVKLGHKKAVSPFQRYRVSLLLASHFKMATFGNGEKY
jgi:hypothetical protein